jgi:hypothetical protein
MSTICSTYSPVIDAKSKVLGVHLRVHGLQSTAEEIIAALNAWAEVWPHAFELTLVEFVGRSNVNWPVGWSAPEKTIVVWESEALFADPNFLALASSAPKVCIRTAEPAGVTHTSVAYLASRPEHFPKVVAIPPQFRRYPVFALDVDEPMQLVRSQAAGTFASSGWSALHWQRKPVDRKVGMLSTILKAIQLIERDGATTELEALLKRDAVLSYKLVALANSAAFGLTVEITSIRHALAMLGRERLKKWLALLLLHAGGQDTPAILIQTAFVRALFLERIGQMLGLGSQRDDLFLCGAFSLLDRILGLPFSELLGRVSLSDEVTEALMEDHGPFAPLLRLAKATEGRDVIALLNCCEELALVPSEVSAAMMSALGSAKEVAAG